MVKRACEACGRRFEATSKLRRFCREATCDRDRRRVQKRRQRGPVGEVVPIRPVVDTASGSLAAAAVAELTEAGRLDSLMGRAAVALADRIDRATVDTGASYASLVRELRATIDAALAGARQTGPVDELRQRRLEKLGQGA